MYLFKMLVYCCLHTVYVCILCLLGYISSAPKGLNYTYKVRKGVENVLLVNLTWNAPESTHGDIRTYIVEYIANDSSTPTIREVTSVGA